MSVGGCPAPMLTASIKDPQKRRPPRGRPCWYRKACANAGLGVSDLTAVVARLLRLHQENRQEGGLDAPPLPPIRPRSLRLEWS